MGLFDEIAGGLLKQVFSSTSAQTGLMEVITGLVRDEGAGGLEGLAQTFSEKGLGDVISSWIGTGENLPISPEQIREVLGSGQVQQIAEKLGVSSDEASNALAEMLPQVIDKLTPGGSLASGDLLEQGLNLIKDRLFGR
jgi:uncharacterized protein YidB (DUF937 family)